MQPLRALLRLLSGVRVLPGRVRDQPARGSGPSATLGSCLALRLPAPVPARPGCLVVLACNAHRCTHGNPEREQTLMPSYKIFQTHWDSKHPGACPSEDDIKVCMRVLACACPPAVCGEVRVRAYSFSVPTDAAGA